MTTKIISNGSKWAGESPDSIEKLIEVLGEHPLDRTFEAFGNFITPDPVNMRGEPLATPGTVSFWGNFHTLSHVFSIDTDEPPLIEKLTAAIRSNQQRPDYLSQPDYAAVQAERAAREAEKQRKRVNDDRRRARAVLGMEG